MSTKVYYIFVSIVTFFTEGETDGDDDINKLKFLENNTTKLGPHIDHKRYISASHVMPDLYLSTEFAIVMYFFL